MRHKTWFRLVLKAIGVLLVGLALPRCITAIIAIVDAALLGDRWTMYTPYSTTTSSGDALQYVFLTALQLLPEFAQGAFGFILFFRGGWIVDKAIPSNRPYCPECGYDLSRNTGPRCSECGVQLPAPPATSGE